MPEQANNLINRREALKRTALMLGGAISAPTALGFLNGCTATPGRGAQHFTENQLEFIAQIADIIIPETDTPGAKAVGVQSYIEDQVFVMWNEEDRKEFLQYMSDFEAKSEAELGKAFITASEQERTDFIYKEHEAVFGGEVNWERPRPFIWRMKEMTITGYFSTETGMTQVLQYTQVPGRYDGCITFEEAGGRVWA